LIKTCGGDHLSPDTLPNLLHTHVPAEYTLADFPIGREVIIITMVPYKIGTVIGYEPHPLGSDGVHLPKICFKIFPKTFHTKVFDLCELVPCDYAN
ncbi:hypothetical protein KJ836_01295, partial [Patescibacteria group bacterium]|nr:hypothetical protein [Patescibacteria group bacterium]